MGHQHRPSAHSIPPGAGRPINPNPSAHMHIFPETDPPLSNPWDDLSYDSNIRRRLRSMYEPTNESLAPGTPNDAGGSNTGFRIPFPEPQIPYTAEYLSPTQSSQHPSLRLRHHSESGRYTPVAAPLHRDNSHHSVASVPAYHDQQEPEYYPELQEDDSDQISIAMSTMDVSSDDLLERFQEGKLKAEDQEWHKLAPIEAQEALGKKEVQRQSVIFEIIKGEYDYVNDLEAVEQLFIDGLRQAQPQIISGTNLQAFIKEVFGNLTEILQFHKKMLKALFMRQLEQHPLILSVADIILDTTIRTDFRLAYENYIKHYPLAESHHRNELKRNRAYATFVQSIISNNPRIRKRDLITFLSRPVTRLPRLNLLLEQTLKMTEAEFEHPDLETLPMILGILKDCIKSTQPGIEAAESKVKFWALCESLVYQKGEIIDMDLYDESRTLVHSSPVSRRTRSDTGFHVWSDLHASLLDNYFLLTREEKRPNNTVRRHLMSRPLYLSYLRLGSFDDPPETRKEKNQDGRLLDSLRSSTISVLPFTIYHSLSRSTRRYTLYVTSESHRRQWKSALIDAIAIHRAREDSNKWFEPEKISDKYFRIIGQNATSAPGRVTSATSFAIANRKFVAVGCSTGIFISILGTEDFKKVLRHSNPRYIAALQTCNKFIVHSDSVIVSYPLDSLARMALDSNLSKTIDDTAEKIKGSDANIVLAKCVQVGKKIILVYASKRRLSSSLTLQVLEAVSASNEPTSRERSNTSFKPLGEPGFVPKDAFDITSLTKNIGICTKDGIAIGDPTNFSQSPVVLIPDLQDAATSQPMSDLKIRLNDARPINIVRVDANELLVIYDMVGIYITKQGVPTRSCGYIKWETPASAAAHRGNHVLLISSNSIEIRNIATGKVVQVIEGKDIRLLSVGLSQASNSKEDQILVAMRGEDDHTDKLLQLVETTEYVPQSSASTEPFMWEEWDM